MNKRETDIIAGLRLAEEKAQELLDGLDKSSGASAYNARGVRAVRRITDLQVALTQPGGTRIEFLVLTRNVSTQGLAFLHGHYVHVGTKFEAQLPSLDGGAFVRVRGKVVRCRHVTGFVHEVAVMFEEPIDLPSFARLSPEEEERCWQIQQGSDKTKVSSRKTVSQTCMVIDDAKSQRAIARVWLSRLGYEVVEFEKPQEALMNLKSQRVDLILLDLILGEHSGVELCKQIRETGFAGMIVAVTADTDPRLHSDAKEAGCDSTLIKPLTGRGLHEAIEQARTASGEQKEDQGPVLSSLAKDSAMAPLIEEYVSGLADTIDSFLSAAESRDVKRLRAQCLSLRSEGGAHGFWQITRGAESVLELIETKASAIEIQRACQRLLSLLRRVSIAA